MYIIYDSQNSYLHQVYTEQESNEPHAAFCIEFPERLTFSFSLLLVSWDSFDPPECPGKGHQQFSPTQCLTFWYKDNMGC